MSEPSRRAVLAGSVALTLAAAPARAGDRRAPGLLTGADVHRAGYPTVKAVEWIGAELERATGGRYRIRHYPSGQLGTEEDALGLARFGGVDFCRVALAAVNNPFPTSQILSLPYVFDSVEHLRRTVDGPVGAAVLKSFEAHGLIGLALYEGGGRCLYNVRRPIVTPADLKGLKIRTPQSDVFMEALAAMGANATPLSFGATFSSLQTHLIDGAENNWPTFESTRHFEVARYWSETFHSFSPDVLLMSKRRFDAMAPRDRELVLDLARRSVPRMRADWDRVVADSRAKAIAGGVRVNAADRVAFARAVRPVLERRLARPGLQDLHRQVRALA